jgi:16S rRNA pseudouridine516 synthase
MRLDHLLQAHAFASSEERLPLKKAQQRIREHGLSVDGVLRKDPKYQVLPGVEAVTDGSGTAVQADHAFCLLNKPAGYVSQRHPTERNVYDLIPPELQRLGLAAFGRLDRDTTGMLLFGTDGGVQSLLLSPSSRVMKTYVATLAAGEGAGESSSPLAADAVAAFAAGLVLEDGTACQPATLELLGGRRVQVTLHEGFFHQVKRMLAAVGGTVVELHRERFGALADATLAPGAMRLLTAAELRSLVDMLPLDRLGNKPAADGKRPVAPPAAAPAPASEVAAGEGAQPTVSSALGKRGRDDQDSCGAET